MRTLQLGSMALLMGMILACSSSGGGEGSSSGGAGGDQTPGAAGTRSASSSDRAGSSGKTGGSSASPSSQTSQAQAGRTGGTSSVGTSAGGASASSRTGGSPLGGTSTAGGGRGGSATGGKTTGGSSPGTGGKTGGSSSSTGGRGPDDAGATGGSSSELDAGATPDSRSADVAIDGSGASRSKGCGKAVTRPDPSAQQSISVSGSARTYQIYVPTGYSSETALPLIFALHGGGGNAAGARNDYKLEAVVGSDAIIVYPNNMTNYASGGDMDFFDAVLDDTLGKYCIDSHRVFATGFSMGGIFVNGVGCLRGGSTVRGIIPVAGSGPNPNLGPASEADIACPSGTPKGDVAVMIIHGTADGNALFKYAQWEANYWTRAEGCTSTTANLSSPYQGCVGYQSCRVPVDFCQHSGGHMVPSTAAANIWAFIGNLP